MTYPVKCGMKSPIHSTTSTRQPLNFGNFIPHAIMDIFTYPSWDLRRLQNIAKQNTSYKKRFDGKNNGKTILLFWNDSFTMISKYLHQNYILLFAIMISEIHKGKPGTVAYFVCIHLMLCYIYLHYSAMIFEDGELYNVLSREICFLIRLTKALLTQSLVCTWERLAPLKAYLQPRRIQIVISTRTKNMSLVTTHAGA